ncbi:MAG: hypothetical protein ABR556_09995 [Pyrinomonadaceae bacterium]
MNKFKNHLIALTAVLALVCTFALPTASASKDLTYTTIDFPGAIRTGAFGINGKGEVVGFYRDAAGTHGFLLSGGNFTSIDFPGAVATDARGINAKGDIVGTYSSQGRLHGYLLSEGIFTTVDFPGHLNTIAQRITPSGLILGCYHDMDIMESMHGFTVRGDDFNEFDVPASMHNGATPNGKTIVGLYTDMTTGKKRGYVLKRGEFNPFDVPGSNLTEAWDINPEKEIVGFYRDLTGKFYGFLRTDDDDDAAAFTTIDYPGAVATRAFGINPGGDVVGSYVDSRGKTHGFLLTRTEQDQ